MKIPQKSNKQKMSFKHHNDDSLSCSFECLMKSLKSKDQKFCRPYPINLGHGNENSCDTLLNLVQRKQESNSKIDTCRNTYKKYEKRIQISKQFKCFQDMQELLTQEPDSYFSSNYNWYYTNGNLTIEKIQDTAFLLYVTNGTELNAAKLKRKNSGWTSTNLGILSNDESPIYQLDSANKNDKTFIGMRQKNKILLYDLQINDSTNIENKLVETHNSDVPFVSLCLNQQNHMEYALVNVKQLLQIHDLNTSKPFNELHVPHNIEVLEGDHFAQVSYYNHNILSYINRTNFYNFDKRSNSHCFCLKHDILENRDRFVNIYPHENSNMCYISTFRDILLYDLRNKSIQSKYSHSFDSAPFISDLICNKKTIFCISSCKPNEKLIIQKENESNYIPISLPTITESFESNLLCCTNLNKSLRNRDRLDLSNTGMKLWMMENTCALFSANIFGDIYCQELTTNNVNTQKYFQKWNNTEKIENDLHFSDKVILHDISFNLDSTPSDLQNIVKKKRLEDCCRNLKTDITQLNTKIRNVWENIEEDQLAQIEEIPADETVRNWLSHHFNSSENTTLPEESNH